MMRAEEKLILYCSRTQIDDNNASKIKSLLSLGLDWAYFFDQAVDEGVLPLVYRSLSSIGEAAPAIPAGIWKKLENGYYSSAVRNSLLYKKLAEILNSFKNSGIAVIVLKGAALAESIYDNVALRPMADIDLLVKKEELVLVDAQLRGMGFSSVDRCLPGIGTSFSYLNSLEYRDADRDCPALHIHYHFVNSSVPNDSYLKNIEIDKIWQEAQPIELATVKTLVMAPHHLLIHLSEHALKVTHSLSRLSHLCDIHETINFYCQDLDWDKLVGQSLEFHLNRMVYFSLYFTHEFLGTCIPQQAMHALKPQRLSWEERIFVGLVARNIRFPGVSYLLHLAMHKGWLQKINFVYKTLFPPAEVLSQRSYIPKSDFRPFRYIFRIKEVSSCAYRGLRLFLTQ